MEGGPFQKVDTANDRTFVWSPCGQEGILNVNNIVSVTARTSNARMRGAMNVFDATIGFEQKKYTQLQKVAIMWRRCGT